MKSLNLIILYTFCFSTKLTYGQLSWQRIGLIFGEAENDRFGYSSSISSDGKIVAIASTFNKGLTESGRGGHVRIYKKANNIWTQMGQDIDGNGLFGESIALSADGQSVAIGAPNDSSLNGSVSVYKFINNSWIKQGRSIFGKKWEELGYAVSLNMDGTVLAIGSELNDSMGTNAGISKIFKKINGEWEQVGQTLFGDGTVSHFGSSISINYSGNIIAVGAIFSNAVYVYELKNGSWQLLGERIRGKEVGSKAGYSTSISSDGLTVVVGEPEFSFSHGNLIGNVSVHKFQNDTWTQIGKDIWGETWISKYGTNISLSADASTLAIGDQYYSPHGRVLIYKNINNEWVLNAEIFGEGYEEFGSSVALDSSGSSIIAGGERSNIGFFHSGIAKIYQFKEKNTNNIQQIKGQILEIYPNPTYNSLNIEGINQSKVFEIYDMMGKLALKGKADNTIDVSTLGPGVYVGKIAGYVFKFVKE